MLRCSLLHGLRRRSLLAAEALARLRDAARPMPRATRVASWGVALVGAALVTAAVDAAPPASLPKTLVYCAEGSPEGFNPQFYALGNTLDASSVPMYNRLVEFKRGTTALVPGLAERWEAAPDGMSYTFHLRPNVSFHSTARFRPSRYFNADDVLFSYNRMADPNHPFHKTNPGQSFSYFEDMDVKSFVDHVEKVDPMTVRFVMKRPESPFLADMGMDFASILSAEYADKMMAAGTPEIIDREPVGTGPWKFHSYQKDAVIRYDAFDAYWGGRPKVDKLVYAITTDASVRYAKLKTGECHVMAYPKPADVKLMKAERDLQMLQQNGLNIGYVSFNVQRKPFDDKRVRLALTMAVNKQSIIATVYQGAGQAAKNIIPPTLWSYNDAIVDHPYDPAKARALLAEAGIAPGTVIDLWYLPVSRPYNPDGKRMAELIQADWAKVGITARLVTFEWGEYRKRSKSGEQQAMMYGWSGDNGDPDNFFGPILSCAAVAGGGNTARWCNKPYEALLQQAKLEVDQTKRAAIYKQAQALIHDEVPLIPIAHSVAFDPIRREVSGYLMDATSHHFFDKTELVGDPR